MKWSILLVFLGFQIAWSQEIRFLECGTVSFFAPCRPVQPPPPPLPSPPPPEPLFTPQTMAPDVPPLLVQLLEEPTLANAQKYLDWQAERQARIQEVQHLLRALTHGEPPQKGTP